jgi:competence protein ComEC
MKRPLTLITIFFALGILFSVYFPNIWFVCLFGAVVLFLTGFIFCSQKHGWCLILFLAEAFFFLGALHAQSAAILPSDHIAYVKVNQIEKIKGIIVSDVSTKRIFSAQKKVFTLEVREIFIQGGFQKCRGKINGSVFKNIDLRYGDEVVLEGRVHYPFDFSESEHFSYPQYLRYHGIVFLCSVKKNAKIDILQHNQANPFIGGILSMRHFMSGVLDKHLSGKEAGIMKAVLLGERSDIPADIKELFLRTGTIHILAISGMNVGFVAVLFMLMVGFLPLSRRTRLMMSLVFLWVYAVLTGAEASVIRATIMASVVIIGCLIERETENLVCVMFAALVILIFNPLTLFDIGFQLSFICIIGILWGMSIFKLPVNLVSQNHFHKLGYSIAVSLIISVSAWLASTGLIAYYFESITPVSIIANLVIIPLFSLVVTLGMGLLLMGVLFPWVAVTFAVCLKLILNISALFLYLFHLIPFGYQLITGFSTLHLIIYYFIVALIFSGLSVYKRKEVCLIDKVHRL